MENIIKYSYKIIFIYFMKTRTRRRKLCYKKKCSVKRYSKSTFGYKNKKTKRTYKGKMRKNQKGG